MYRDFTSGKDKLDDIVPPNKTYVYTWSVPDHVGPTTEDAQCLTRAYYSSIDPIKDTHSGKSSHTTSVVRNITMQCSAMQCKQCNTMQCNAIQCNAMQYNAMQAMQYSAMQSNTMQCNTIQYIAIQYKIMQCNVTQCNTIQVSTIQ